MCGQLNTHENPQIPAFKEWKLLKETHPSPPLSPGYKAGHAAVRIRINHASLLAPPPCQATSTLLAGRSMF
jgi:hypothetical protein